MHNEHQGEAEQIARHLWEVDHPYYCNERAYSDSAPVQRYKSFGEFLADWDKADLDMNLVFRWDWREGDEWGASAYNGDDNYRNGLLSVFFMGQRKGLFWSHEVEVCRADEPAVIAYLRPRLETMRQLWAPLALNASAQQSASTAIPNVTPPGSHIRIPNGFASEKSGGADVA